MAAPLDQKYVVAVLPFENLSADSARGYFAAGMTEEITGQLSRLSALRVLGRNTLTSYTNAPDRIPRMVKDLGVGSGVEGTVQVEGNRARVGVQLIDGQSRQTIWTERYDRELADVFGVQRDIAQRITTALQASLTPAEAHGAGRPPTVDLAAYELYVRAGETNRFVATENLEGIKLWRRAVARDSNFAAAYAELARRFMFLGYSQGPAYFDSGLWLQRGSRRRSGTGPSSFRARWHPERQRATRRRGSLVSQDTPVRSELRLGDDGFVDQRGLPGPL